MKNLMKVWNEKSKDIGVNFSESQHCICKDFEELLKKLGGKCYSTGVSYSFKDLFFINQAPASSEFAFIKGDTYIDSLSTSQWIKDNIQEFISYLAAYIDYEEDKPILIDDRWEEVRMLHENTEGSFEFVDYLYGINFRFQGENTGSEYLVLTSDELREHVKKEFHRCLVDEECPDFLDDALGVDLDKLTDIIGDSKLNKYRNTIYRENSDNIINYYLKHTPITRAIGSPDEEVTIKGDFLIFKMN